jgi:hypothetical protein
MPQCRTGFTITSQPSTELDNQVGRVSNSVREMVPGCKIPTGIVSGCRGLALDGEALVLKHSNDNPAQRDDPASSGP